MDSIDHGTLSTPKLFRPTWSRFIHYQLMLLPYTEKEVFLFKKINLSLQFISMKSHN